jgi:hypothetical protein
MVNDTARYKEVVVAHPSAQRSKMLGNDLLFEQFSKVHNM